MPNNRQVEKRDPKGQPEPSQEMATMTMPQPPTPSPVLQANQPEKPNGLRNMANGKALKLQVEDNKKKGPMQEGQECAKNIMAAHPNKTSALEEVAESSRNGDGRGRDELVSIGKSGSISR
ncbi:hypothetical protein OIU76_029902 [Salix suchowensis]|nr:hypothetical protein OIU76_029902 [Salix suchowensis]